MTQRSMKAHERPSQFKTARYAAGLTQEQAAQLLGVPTWTLKGWEARARAPALAVEMLLLKTGQFSSVSSRKAELRLRLTGGGGSVVIPLPKGMSVVVR